MMVNASATFLLLLVALSPLDSIRGAKKPQPLEASDKPAEANGATLPAEETVEVLKPADAVVAEIASADKAAEEEVPGAMPTESRPAEEAAEVPVPSAVRALRGTALPVATGIAISTVNAVAATALSPPVDTSLASPGSMLKTIGLTSSSILQLGPKLPLAAQAVAALMADAAATRIRAAIRTKRQAAAAAGQRAIAPTPLKAAAAAGQRVIAPTPLNALDAFCGRWVEDKTRRRVAGDGPGQVAFEAMLAQDAFEEQVWLDDNGVLCSKDASGQSGTFPLNQPSSVYQGGGFYTKTSMFQHGHMITTMRKMSTDEPESVMSLQMHNSCDFAIDRWIDKNQLHLVVSLGRDTLSTILNREGLKTCSKPA